MTRLPIVDAGTMEKVLFSLGFSKTRQRGSHAFYRHSDGRHDASSPSGTGYFPPVDACDIERNRSYAGSI
ncbi:MAG: type II toxin-antitoxin system HicA family toxin [Pirellulales bacterium]|nr:type II toxin-antitoxin system HicA family toxin [Pirellulales bacterium]